MPEFSGNRYIENHCSQVKTLEKQSKMHPLWLLRHGLLMFQLIALALRYVPVDLCRCLQPLDRGSFSWIYDKHNKPLWIYQGPVRPRSCRIFSTQNPRRSWLRIGFRKENPYNFGDFFPLPFYSIFLGKFCYILWDMFRSSSDALELIRFASEKALLKNELWQIKEWAFQCLFLDDTMSTRLGSRQTK